jgi:16S rRNA (guanine1516-N2)-methyltransferase
VAVGVTGHRALLDALGIERAAEAPAGDFVLGERDGRLDLRPPGEADRPGVCARFPPDRERSRRGPQPLVRAFGRSIHTVFDLTAGFGADAYRLAEAGRRVVACERDAAVYAVLASGWQRDCAEGRVPDEVASRLEFRHAEGMELLEGAGGAGVGVYLDPMYPPARRGRALPRRALQVLRQRQGEGGPAHPTGDAAAPLLAAARARVGRVVVKRPHRAPPLAADVSHAIESKLVRFDVYVRPEPPKEEAVEETSRGPASPPTPRGAPGR